MSVTKSAGVEHHTPAELLKATLKALRMRQVDLCRRTGLSPKHVNQLALGTVGVTPEMALLLERATGVLAEQWMTAELNRRRIQGGTVALQAQLAQAALHAVRTEWPAGAGVDGRTAVTAGAVAIAAMQRLLDELGIPVWEGVLSPCVSESGSPAGDELTSE